MAHELSYNLATGQHEVVVARIDAWHRLGVRVDNCFTAEEGMTLSGLARSVSKYPLYRQLPDGSYRQCHEWCEVSRDDTDAVLGYVSPSYSIVQAHTMFTLADALCGQGLAIYDTMGSCYGGSLIFASLRLRELEHFAPQGDNHDIYLNCMNSYDGSKPLTLYLSTVRAVCKNTVDISLQLAQGTTRIKHTAHAGKKITTMTSTLSAESLDDTVSLVRSTVQGYKDTLELWQSRVVTDKAFDSYMGQLMPVLPSTRYNTRRDTRVQDIQALYERYNDTAQIMPGQPGTAYNLFQAIVDYADHDKNVRITKSSHTQDADILRAEAAVQGHGARLKYSARELMDSFSLLLPERPTVLYSYTSDTEGYSYLEQVDSAPETLIIDSTTPLLDSILAERDV
jgi:phage/plasmid-like protein (TIGR03299 family)